MGTRISPNLNSLSIDFIGIVYRNQEIPKSYLKFQLLKAVGFTSTYKAELLLEHYEVRLKLEYYEAWIEVQVETERLSSYTMDVVAFY